MASIWDILEINETTDEDALKRAYRAKLVHTNPEDHPEEFKQLRQAYEQALEQARQSEKTAQHPENEPGAESYDEDTPVGRWMERVRQLYDDFYERIQAENWEQLFEDDVCIGLESSDEARISLLRFFSSHMKLPNKIWRLVDQTFFLTQDKQELYEIFPKDYIDYILSLVKYENFLDYTLFEGEGESGADFDQYIDDYFLLRQASADGNYEEGEKICQKLMDQDIYHPFTEAEWAFMQMEKGDIFTARQILDRLWEDHPKSAYIANGYVRVLILDKDFQAAEPICREILEQNPKNYGANLAYARCLCQKEMYAEAKERIMDLFELTPGDENAMKILQEVNIHLIRDYEEKLKETPGDQTLLLDMGWCLCQNETYDQCLEMLLTFEPDAEHQYDYINLRGRIYLCMERYEEALPWLMQWRQMILDIFEDPSREYEKRKKRLGYANYAVACCYSWMGEHSDSKLFPQALKYIEEAIESEKELRQHFNCIYVKAEILNKMGQHEQCIDVCTELLEEETGFFPAYILRQEAFLALGLDQKVVDDFYRATRVYPYHPRPYELAAKVFMEHQEEKEALDIIAQAEKVSAMTDELRLIKLRCLRLLAKEKKDYDLALEYAKNVLDTPDPDRTPQWIAQLKRVMALCYLESGQHVQALETISESVKENPSDDSSRIVKARILECTGQESQALCMYLDLVSHLPDNAFLTERIGQIYARRKDWKKSVFYIKKALALEPDYPRIHFTLGHLYREIAEEGNNSYWEKALKHLDQAVLRDNTVECHMERGDAYYNKGDYASACEDFRWILAREPENQEAMLSMAYACLCMKAYETAVQWFEKCLNFFADSDLYPGICARTGQCYERMGDLQKALYYYDLGLEKRPQYDKLYMHKGVMLLRQKAYEKAAGVFQAGIEHCPEKKEVFADKLCIAWLLLGQRKNARQWWKLLMIDRELHWRFIGGLRAGQYALYIERKPAKARRCFEKAVHMVPEKDFREEVCTGKYFLGCTWYMSGNKTMAARYFYESRELMEQLWPQLTAKKFSGIPVSHYRLWSRSCLWLAHCRDEALPEENEKNPDLLLSGLKALFQEDPETGARCFVQAGQAVDEYDIECEGWLRLTDKR